MRKLVKCFPVLLALCALVMSACFKDSSNVLKIGDCHPDRNSGVGAVLERINAEFKEKVNPEISFAVESYQDQPWQEKARIYATANQLPDVFKWWTYPSMVNQFIKAGQLEKLNKADFAEFGYLPGALESCEVNGELYGVPASGDMWVLYINKSLFAKAGVPLPATWEDVIAAVPAFRAQNIIPMVTNGMEGWPLCIFYDNIAQRINGDFSRVCDAIDRKNGVKFTDPDFVQAAKYIQDMVKAGVFSANLTTSDYGDAQNQFLQERAAIYMMGSWEMGMAVNANFSDSFRQNLDVIKFPAIRGGSGDIDDAMVWFGGSFVVSAHSKNKELALEYLQFLAERFGAYCWEMGAGFPAQIVTPREEDSAVSKKLLQFTSETRSISGAPGLDYGKTTVFKEEFQELIRQLCALLITPEDFCQKLDAAAEQDAR